MDNKNREAAPDQFVGCYVWKVKPGLDCKLWSVQWLHVLFQRTKKNTITVEELFVSHADLIFVLTLMMISVFPSTSSVC